MKCGCRKTSTLIMLACVGILLCSRSQPLDGQPQDRAGQASAGYRGAGKILVPHKSWPCGMAKGIPVPERGAPVFEAEMKLDQAYDLGKTPYGRRTVFVIQGGTISGEKINGLTLPESICIIE